MSVVIETLIIGGIGVASVLGVGVIGKMGVVMGSQILYNGRRKYEKKQLKKELSLCISKLDYTNFVSCIYKIKNNYDNKYHKDLYNKMKYFYKFSDNDVERKEYFLKRFDTDYLINEELITAIVKREVELSLSMRPEQRDIPIIYT